MSNRVAMLPHPAPRLRPSAARGAWHDPTPVLTAGPRPEDRPHAVERDGFEARMNAAWPWVTRLVERLLGWPGRASDVEDVAQEVFLAAWRGRERFRGESEWSTWIHAIAVSKARNAARSRERRRRWFGVLLPASDLEREDRVQGAAGGDGHWEARRALAALRHADREVLVLRYLEELERDSLAERLGIGLDALDARLSRARRRLREILPSAAFDGGAEGRR